MSNDGRSLPFILPSCRDAVVSSVAELHTVHLHADANVPGQLAFRLVGNRHSGVYVFGMNQESQQVNIIIFYDYIKVCVLKCADYHVVLFPSG